MINELESVLRMEYKYLLQDEMRYKLQPYFSKILHEDPYNNSLGYLVRSLYFDTVDDRDYFEKLDGLSQRRKLRLRTYDTNKSIIKLELKEKSGQYQRKRSLSLSKTQALAISSGDYSVLRSNENPFMNEVYNLMVCQTYRPKCIVEYRRFAYIQPENNIRITFDSDVRACASFHGFFDPHLVCCPVMSFGTSLMEVKYDRFLLSFIKQLLNECDGSMIAISKYCLAKLAGV